MTNTIIYQEPSNVTRMIDLLNDLHEALEENAYTEEANVVMHHIEHLKSPQTAAHIDSNGINKVMEELAEGFTKL